MPEICRFFGIVIRMFYDEHNPPHVHAQYQGHKAMLDFSGNILKGDLKSRTAVKLVREWIDMRQDDLNAAWQLAQAGQEIGRIAPLD